MIYSIEWGMLKHGELIKGPCKKYCVQNYVREIWKRDERYGERDMRYIIYEGRKIWLKTSQVFTTDIIEWDPLR